MPTFDPQNITLAGSHVRLESLTLSHAADLFEAGRASEIWNYMAVPPQQTVHDTESWIGEALAAAKMGSQIPLAIIHRETGRAIGSTRYMDIRREHRGLEIGWTWIDPAHQRSPVNTECKALLLGQAFDGWGAIRVCLKTDSRNVGSQRAIERIGAVREGTLLNHMITWDGHFRDTVYFAITEAMWPEVKTRLAGMMASD